MHIMIIGAAGMIGRKLADRLADKNTLNNHIIEQISLVDVIAPESLEGFVGKVNILCSDLSLSGESEKLSDMRPDIIFHLAAIVSGEAEANFEKGYSINFDGTRSLFEAIRVAGDTYQPRVIFSSSVAVYGAPLPDLIDDDYVVAPLTSYGTQKAMCELLLADYSRRHFFDGLGIRLPTICIRPGRPNLAASGFFSNILREPLNGEEAILPVDESLRHWFASPRAAVEFLIHGAELDTTVLGSRRTLNMPGVSFTVGEEIDALRRFGGEKAVSLIQRKPDPKIQAMISGWAHGFNPAMAIELGFRGDASLDEMIQVYIEDELQKDDH